MALVVFPNLVLTKLSGSDFGSIYIMRGNQKMGLGFGAIVFFNFATSAFLFFAERYTSIDRLITAVVWRLVFSFANGFMEELWLRGIFLSELIGWGLTRPKTIADGFPICGFRFKKGGATNIPVHQSLQVLIENGSI